MLDAAGESGLGRSGLIEVIPPLPALRPYFLHFMLLQLEGPTHLPAWLSVNVTVYFQGCGWAHRSDGGRSPIPRFAVSGPSRIPRQMSAQPGSRALSVMFRPGLLEDAWGVPVAEVLDRIVPAEELLGAGNVASLLAGIDACGDNQQRVQAVQNFLCGTLRPGRGRRLMARAFLAAQQRLFQPLAEMALHFGLGERQIERHVQRAFGLPLREVRRMARVGWALPRLLPGGVDRGGFTALAQDAGFFDQAHMHREFVEFCGFGPAELRRKILDQDPALWVLRISPEQFAKLYLSEG